MRMQKNSKSLKRNWVKIKNLCIYSEICVDKKNKTSVVLVHGLSVSSRYMRPTAKLLAQHYNVYAPDLPGFGKSDDPAHVLSLPELSDLLAIWMKKMKIKKAVFLGNSLGCQIIIDIAIRHPSLISHAVLVGPTVDQYAKNFLEQFYRLTLDIFFEPISYYPILIKLYAQAGIRRTIKTFHYALKQNEVNDVKKIKVPTLILRGARDPIVSQKWVVKLNNLIPKSKLVVIPKAGHALNFNSPERLVSAIRTFLQ